MRWEHLFDDLESQLQQELAAEDDDLRVEEERLRRARLGLRERLLAHHRHGGGAPLRLVLADGSDLALRTDGFGRDWLSGIVAAPIGGRCIVPIGAIAQVVLDPSGTGAAAMDHPMPAEDPSALTARLGLPFVLRDLARRRRPVRLLVPGGELTGTLDRVGRDHLDLAVHALDEPRRDRSVRGRRLIALAQLLRVRW
jgi:hypothetical protein